MIERVADGKLHFESTGHSSITGDTKNAFLRYYYIRRKASILNSFLEKTMLDLLKLFHILEL